MSKINFSNFEQAPENLVYFDIFLLIFVKFSLGTSKNQISKFCLKIHGTSQFGRFQLYSELAWNLEAYKVDFYQNEIWDPWL